MIGSADPRSPQASQRPPLFCRGQSSDPSWGATPGTVLFRLPETRIGVTRSVIYQRGCPDRSRGDLDFKSRAARPDCNAFTVSKTTEGLQPGSHEPDVNAGGANGRSRHADPLSVGLTTKLSSPTGEGNYPNQSVPGNS